MGFVHLRLHTEYSLADSIIRVEPPKRKTGAARYNAQSLSVRAAELGLWACAVTDRQNVFAMVKFYKSAEAAGIKPIIGADVWIESDLDREPPTLMTLLVQNGTGYRNLTRLLSRSFTESTDAARLKREWLDEAGEGLIALAGADSELGQAMIAGRKARVDALLEEWTRRFPGRFYLAITRCGRDGDEVHLRAAARLGREAGLPLVATNDVRFLKREDFDAHEARVCIAQGRVLDDPRRPKDYTPEQYLKSAEEMQTLFADLPEALENSVEIARRCTLTLKFGVNHLPRYPVEDGEGTEAELLTRRAVAGLEHRLATAGASRPVEEYRQRLEYELKVIEQMGFPGYFLVVADFIAWSKKNDVPVGPGRGSGAGSLVAYATGITDLDPLPYDLLFERFLNPDRVSLPDFDVDFCMEGRDKVIDYVAQRYGRDRVGQIITYSTMAARGVVRDVARIMGHPYGFGDRIAKTIPGLPGATLADALDESPELAQAYKAEEEVRAVIDLGLALEGVTRGVGVHAGGVVIAPQPLTDYAPLYCEPGGSGIRTQFDMKDLESVGLVKFDFLGLKTLTILQGAVELVRASTGKVLDLLALPQNDADTYRLFASGRTTAVFQMESAGMQRASVDLKPDCFEDIIALISLYRPGPMELIPEYVERKHGRSPVVYIEPNMEVVLRPTFGIFVYQEQVMQIAQRLAGYTLGGADLLRRAMGKKKPEEMAQQREIFQKGAGERGIDAAIAASVFDQMEKFANYGFNKSHAAAYALVSYQSAWLKTHYPAHFMAAVLSCEMDHTETVVLMLDECRRMKLVIQAPDVNRSLLKFSVSESNAIVYGLGAIRGVGAAALEGILAERDANGAYLDLFDFCQRVDSRKTNRRVIEALLGAGALDGLGLNRPSLLATLPKALAAAEQSASSRNSGQHDMFGLGGASSSVDVVAVIEPDWTDHERLSREKDTLGFYLSGHPIETFRPLIEGVCPSTLGALIAQQGQTQIAGGSSFGGGDDEDGPIVASAPRRPRRVPTLIGAWLADIRNIAGDRPGKLLTFDDRSAQVVCWIDVDLWMRFQHVLRKDTLIFITGEFGQSRREGRDPEWRIYPRLFADVDSIVRDRVERIILSWKANSSMPANALSALLTPYKAENGALIAMHFSNSTASGTLDFASNWRLKADWSLLQSLNRLLGSDRVQVHYRRWQAPVQQEAISYNA